MGRTACLACGGLFILSLALALSAWIGNHKAFEWICLTLSYLVPANPPSYLDLAHPQVEGCTDLLLYPYTAVIATVLLVLAVIGRRRHLVA